jgi:RNA polymerase sigma factor (sigma-70 family)
VTELNPAVYDLVPSVTNSIHRRYKNFIEKPDLAQECYAWAAGRANYINEQLAEENPEQNKHNLQRIAWQMRRVAERYARRQKADKSGYSVTDETYYETATLGQLLPFVIASVVDGTVLEQAQDMIKDGQPRGSSSPSEGGNLLAVLIDIKKAYLKLEQPDKDLLLLRHHEGLTLQQIAEVYGCALSTADRRCSNSLRKLQNLLGGDSPFR